jgi:hypothetical protein
MLNRIVLGGLKARKYDKEVRAAFKELFGWDDDKINAFMEHHDTATITTNNREDHHKAVVTFAQLQLIIEEKEAIQNERNLSQELGSIIVCLAFLLYFVYFQVMLWKVWGYERLIYAMIGAALLFFFIKEKYYLRLQKEHKMLSLYNKTFYYTVCVGLMILAAVTYVVMLSPFAMAFFWINIESSVVLIPVSFSISIAIICLVIGFLLGGKEKK